LQSLGAAVHPVYRSEPAGWARWARRWRLVRGLMFGPEPFRSFWFWEPAVQQILNRLLADDLSANRFVTFALVFLDPTKSEVEVLSAGHGPILWYKHDTHELENLEAQGIPLGMIAGVNYEQALVRRLGPNDMIVMVTDGFYEWENANGQEFGLQRLESVILQAHDCSAEDVIARLRFSVEDFCGGTEQKDDLTAVVLKRKGVAMPADNRPDSLRSTDAAVFVEVADSYPQ